jgi:hypothetical protein
MTRNGTPSTLLRIPPALIGQVIDYYIGRARAEPRRDELFAAIISALTEVQVVDARICPTEPRSAIVVVDADDAAAMASVMPEGSRVPFRTPHCAAFLVSTDRQREHARKAAPLPTEVTAGR